MSLICKARPVYCVLILIERDELRLLDRFVPQTDVRKRLKRLKRVWVHGVNSMRRKRNFKRKKNFFGQKNDSKVLTFQTLMQQRGRIIIKKNTIYERVLWFIFSNR